MAESGYPALVHHNQARDTSMICSTLLLGGLGGSFFSPPPSSLARLAGRPFFPLPLLTMLRCTLLPQRHWTDGVHQAEKAIRPSSAPGRRGRRQWTDDADCGRGTAAAAHGQRRCAGLRSGRDTGVPSLCIPFFLIFSLFLLRKIVSKQKRLHLPRRRARRKASSPRRRQR